MCRLGGFVLRYEIIMNDERPKRKLAAILSADVKGYGRLMGEDELSTLRTLETCRGLMAELIAEYYGRLVDSPGDNVLAEFASAVDAVQAGIYIQKRLKAKNSELPANRRMEFRIGINLGDVIEKGGSIYGNGVNIAARLEALAEGGGICVSGKVYEEVKNKVTFGFEFLGEQNVKNISEPVPVYRVRMETGSTVPEISRRIKLPQKPSIAVLPFTNMSDDPEQEYFSDGITEDLITDLSKISALFVIARNSVFTYKGKSVKVQEVGRELGVSYVLEGSVRKAGDRVRITAQLVNADTGGHLWAERYDRDFEDIFALQDEVTGKIVSVLKVKLTAAEKERRSCKCKYTCDMEAYDYFLRGLKHFNRFTTEANIQAREMFEKAVDLDPKYALAHAMLGQTHLLEWTLGWSQDPHSVDRAFEWAQRALALDESLAEGHELLGNIYLWKKQHDRAIRELEEAISLDPNNADWLAGLGSVLLWAGKPDKAIGMMEEAMRLNPMGPVYYEWSLGHAYLLTEQFENAIRALRKVLYRNPDFWPAHILLAATYSEMGLLGEARAAVAETLKINPNFSLESWRHKCPFKDQAVLERRFRALRRAGLQ